MVVSQWECQKVLIDASQNPGFIHGWIQCEWMTICRIGGVSVSEMAKAKLLLVPLRSNHIGVTKRFFWGRSGQATLQKSHVPGGVCHQKVYAPSVNLL